MITIIIAARLVYLEEQGNFHIVTKGELYRSAQLDKDELTRYIKKYHIKSILNLIGNYNNKQYKQELKICKELNVVHYDYGFSATNMLSLKSMKVIIAIFNKLPKPILIHCKAGADRSGLAAAIWLYKVKHYRFKKAFNQLSVMFGHSPYFGSPTVAMDKSFIELKTAKIDKEGKKYE